MTIENNQINVKHHFYARSKFNGIWIIQFDWQAENLKKHFSYRIGKTTCPKRGALIKHNRKRPEMFFNKS